MKVHNLLVTGSLTSGGENITSISSSVSDTILTLSSSVSTSIGSLSSSMSGRFDTIESTTGSLNSFTSSANNRLNSIEGVTGSYSTTGSNLFVGTQTISGSIIPAVNNTYDLGSTTQQFRDLYLSSASLYIDGVKVLGSTAQELQITTDAGQSFKILEDGSDTITLQSTNGNITLASSGGGDVILDPTNGIVALKGTTTVYAGNKILSSDGNNIHFGNGVTMTGSLTVSGFIETQELRTTFISSSILYRSGSTKFGDELTDTHDFTGSLNISGSLSVPGSNLVSGSSQITYSGLSSIPSGIISGSSQLPSGLVSGSSQITYGSINGIPSGILSGSSQVISLLPGGTVSGSVQVDVMSTTNIARLATTGSNTFTGTQTIGTLSTPTSGGNLLSIFGSNSATNMQVFTTTNHATFFEANTNSGSIVTRLQSQNASFVGTLTNNSFDIVANGTTVIRTTGDGNVTLGTTNTGADGLSLSNDKNLSFAEGSGLSYVNVFRQINTAALIMGAGYKRSLTGAFASSFSSGMARAAIGVGYNNGSIAFFSDPLSTVSNGTDITPTERLTLINNGNLGLNITNPTAKFHVVGDVRINGGIYLFDDSGNNYGTYIRANNYPSQGYTSNSNYWLELGSRGGTHIVVNTDGGSGSVENPSDDFTVWQGAIDGQRLLSVSNVGNTNIFGKVRIGSTFSNGTVTLDMSSETDGINLPKGTTAQRPTPTSGTMRFNTTTSALEFFDGSAWNGVKADTTVGSAVAPAATALQIYNAYNGTAPDGVYYYTNASQVYQAYTKFNWIEDEHWVLVLKVHNRGDMTSGNALWRNTTLSNESDFNLTSGTMSKYASFVYHPFTRILMDMNGTYPAVMIWNTLQTSIQAITNANPGGNLTGYACDATNPAIGNSRRYDSAGFYIQGGPFSAQTGFEPVVQEYGISCFANNSSNSTTDNAGLSSVGYAGAYIGCPMDEGGHVFNNVSNSGSDSGFGFGGGAGNEPRTWSAGYGEWSTSAVVNTLPGYVWIR